MLATLPAEWCLLQFCNHIFVFCWYNYLDVLEKNKRRRGKQKKKILCENEDLKKAKESARQ